MHNLISLLKRHISEKQDMEQLICKFTGNTIADEAIPEMQKFIFVPIPKIHQLVLISSLINLTILLKYFALPFS